MTDTELLKSLRAALELAQFAEVNIELTPDELAWLLDRAEALINMTTEFKLDDIDIFDAVLTDEAEE